MHEHEPQRACTYVFCGGNLVVAFATCHVLGTDIQSVCAGPAEGAAASALPNGAAAPLPSDQAPAHQAPKLSASAQVQMEAALQKDAFLVFRALCKLSVRASETATGTDMTAIRGKVSCSQPCHSPTM